MNIHNFLNWMLNNRLMIHRLLVCLSKVVWLVFKLLNRLIDILVFS